MKLCLVFLNANLPWSADDEAKNILIWSRRIFQDQICKAKSYLKTCRFSRFLMWPKVYAKITLSAINKYSNDVDEVNDNDGD